jgi:hypothetical protein
MRKSKLQPIIIFTPILLFFGFFIYDYFFCIEIHNVIADCFLKNDPYFPNYADKIDEEIFKHFRSSYHGDAELGNKTDLSLSLLFGINNIFSAGTVYMDYSLLEYDRSGNLLSENRNIPITIHVKKLSTGWKIVRIDEAP